MDIVKIYAEFIANRLANPPSFNEYTETHHIVPRCVGGNDSDENLIRLKPEDHLFAHFLLSKIYFSNSRNPPSYRRVILITPKEYKGIVSAYHLMTVHPRISGSRIARKLYGNARRERSENAILEVFQRLSVLPEAPKKGTPDYEVLIFYRQRIRQGNLPREHVAKFEQITWWGDVGKKDAVFHARRYQAMTEAPAYPTRDYHNAIRFKGMILAGKLPEDTAKLFQDIPWWKNLGWLDITMEDIEECIHDFVKAKSTRPTAASGYIDRFAATWGAIDKFLIKRDTTLSAVTRRLYPKLKTKEVAALIPRKQNLSGERGVRKRTDRDRYSVWNPMTQKYEGNYKTLDEARSVRDKNYGI